MKVLLLNQAFYPDVASTAQHLSELAVGLAELGHEVTVVAGRRGYDAPERRYAAEETWRGVRVVRVWSSGFGKGGRWRRGLDFATFLVACGWGLRRVGRAEVVVALTSPPLIGVVGAVAAWVWRSRLACWVMDLNPDEAVAAGWLRQGSAAARVLEWLSRWSLRRASRVVVLDRFMRERVVGKGVEAGKVRVLPPWSHDGEVRFEPAGRERFRKAHGLEGRFVVMYSGNHSPCHPLDTLVSAARRLGGGEVVFCFVGGGSEWRRLREELRGPQVVFVAYQRLEELAGSLSAADLQVVVMGQGMVGIVHPCKVYNALRVGAPVLYIGPRESHVTDLGGSPWVRLYCVNHGDVDGVVEAIGQARRERYRGGACAGEGFSRERVLPELIREIDHRDR